MEFTPLVWIFFGFFLASLFYSREHECLEIDEEYLEIETKRETYESVLRRLRQEIKEADANWTEVIEEMGAFLELKIDRCNSHLKDLDGGEEDDDEIDN